jgi:hypothetical protein
MRVRPRKSSCSQLAPGLWLYQEQLPGIGLPSISQVELQAAGTSASCLHRSVKGSTGAFLQAFPIGTTTLTAGWGQLLWNSYGGPDQLR